MSTNTPDIVLINGSPATYADLIATLEDTWITKFATETDHLGTRRVINGYRPNGQDVLIVTFRCMKCMEDILPDDPELTPHVHRHQWQVEDYVCECGDVMARGLWR